MSTGRGFVAGPPSLPLCFPRPLRSHHRRGPALPRPHTLGWKPGSSEVKEPAEGTRDGPPPSSVPRPSFHVYPLHSSPMQTSG